MSDLLLDTQMALWVMCDEARFPAALRAEMQRGEHHVIFHQASAWEIQIKYQLRKLPLPQQPSAYLPEKIKACGFSYERIRDEAIFFLGKLPSLHRDPFDRLLVAHAIVNGWTLVTADKILLRYPVKTLSAA